MSKLYSLIKIVSIVVAIVNSGSKIYAQSNNEVYNLTIEELMSVNVIPDSAVDIAPTYEISIEDLMNLELVRELKTGHYLDVTYDFSIEDLMQLKIDIKRDAGIEPTYEMSLQGLTTLEIKERISIVTKIGITYDLTLDGLMKLSLKDPEQVRRNESE